jgi:chemotaxis protein MotB
LTLLFALFIILYSISKPDAEKMQEILRAMNNVFNPNQIIDGNNLVPEVASQDSPPLILFPAQPVSIPEMQNQVEEKLSTLIENKSISLEKLPEGLKLTLPNKFLFSSAKANLLYESEAILDTIVNAVSEIDMQIQVDGHTDAIPIKSFTYASN